MFSSSPFGSPNILALAGRRSAKVVASRGTGRGLTIRFAFAVAALVLATASASGGAPEKDPIVAEATSKATFVLAEFVSKTCPACDEMQPVLKAVLSRHPDLNHQVYDADFELDLSKKYRVRCVPVYVIVDPRGEVKFNDVGMFTEEELEEVLQRAGLSQ